MRDKSEFMKMTHELGIQKLRHRTQKMGFKSLSCTQYSTVQSHETSVKRRPQRRGAQAHFFTISSVYPTNDLF